MTDEARTKPKQIGKIITNSLDHEIDNVRHGKSPEEALRDLNSWWLRRILEAASLQEALDVTYDEHGR